MKVLMMISVLMSPMFGVAQAQMSEVDSQFMVAAQALPKVKGVIRRIDAANAKITLKHEEIPNLQMPGMTMPFNVAVPEMLEGLAIADKVLFTADEINGELTVMWIEKRP